MKKNPIITPIMENNYKVLKKIYSSTYKEKIKNYNNGFGSFISL
jgi:hypothetical protein